MKASAKVGIARSVAGEWSIALPSGATEVHRSPLALLDAVPSRHAAVFRDQTAARELVEAGIRRSLARSEPLPDVGLRAGKTAGATMAIATAKIGSVMIIDGELSVAADDVAAAPEGRARLVEPWQVAGRAELREQAAAVLELVDQWQAEVASCGIPARLAAGSTAAQLLPQAWIRAAKALRKQHGELFGQLDKSRYGGRVECPQPDWSGEAVEYDIRSAYGAALGGYLGRLPDCQLYPSRRDPLPEQPSWWDVTVRVDHEVAPLPQRDPEVSWRIHWPQQGEWRGWYTGLDLEQPGITILETHEVHCGRYGGQLEAPVQALLGMRDGHGPWRRAVVRQLTVSLAGKLAERAGSWRLWAPATGGEVQRAPKGLVQLGGLDSLVMAYPVEEQPKPHNQPGVSSYLTARVRRKLADALRSCPSAIYCDTDSIHLPADAAPPAGIGTIPGDWAVKSSGPAFYRGRRSYRLGSKVVGNPDLER